MPGPTPRRVRSGSKTCNIMEALGFVFIIVILIVGGILAWTYTKKGEEWLKNL